MSVLAAAVLCTFLALAVASVAGFCAVVIAIGLIAISGEDL